MIIYTAITNHYDVLKAPAVLTPGAHYVAFVDSLDYEAPSPWELRLINFQERNPRVTTRRYKLTPHNLFREVAVSVWVDASLWIIQDFTPLLAYADPFAAFAHPDRDCVYDEATTVLKAGVASQERVAAQVATYRAVRYPAHRGLFAGGVLVRRHHDPRLIAASEAWLADVRAYSQRDQLSGMVALWREGLTYTPLPGLMSDYTQYVHHPQVNAYLSGGH